MMKKKGRYFSILILIIFFCCGILGSSLESERPATFWDGILVGITGWYDAANLQRPVQVTPHYDAGVGFGFIWDLGWIIFLFFYGIGQIKNFWDFIGSVLLAWFIGPLLGMLSGLVLYWSIYGFVFIIRGGSPILLQILEELIDVASPWLREYYHFLLLPVSLLILGFGIWLYVEEVEGIGIVPILVGGGLLLWNLWGVGFITLVLKGIAWVFDGIALFFTWLGQHVS